MSNWQEKVFGELGKCIRGVSYKPADLRPAPGMNAVTLLRSNNIRGGQLNFRDLQFVDARTVREEQKLQDTDIAICMSNGNRALVGKTGQFTQCNDGLAYTVGAFCSIFRPAPEFDAGYVRHLFGSPAYQKQLDRILAGSAINNLKGSDVDTLVAICPKDRSEQTKIAEILSTVDRAIEQTEALIAKQQRIKTGLMQDLLTRGIDEQGNLRSEQTHKFKDSPLGRIPEEWECGNVLAFASRKRQPILTGPFGSSLGTDDFVDYGVPVLRIGNVQAGFMELGDLNYVNEEKAMELSRYRVQEGDLLFARSGATTGRNALADHRCNEVLINYHIIRVATDKDRCDPTFLYSLFNSDLVRRQVDQEKGKSTREGVNTATILSLALLIPSVNEQRRIGQLIRSVDNQIETLKRQHEKARQVKTALMQDLLTGEKRVTPLLDADVTEDAVHA